MSKVYEFELEKWREHQSNFDKFLTVLKNQDLNNLKDSNKDHFLLKMLQLNEMVDKIDVLLDEIKYECLYPNSDKKDHKKIKREIQEHLQYKTIIKSLVKNMN
jgi:hypothetical protein